jgi:hypothetical protein
VGYFDGDGHRDAVVLAASQLALFPGNGDGTFATKVVLATLTGGPPMWASGAMTTADLDGDGVLDILHVAGTSIVVRINNGDGTFAPPATYDVAAVARAVVAAPLDIGLSNDVAVLDENGAIHLFANSGDGTLQARTSLITATDSGAASLAVAEVTGDGNYDLVTGAVGVAFSNVWIYSGHGDLTFDAGVPRGAGSSPQGLAVADVGGNGSSEIIVGNTAGRNTVSVLAGHNDGAFDVPVPYASAPDPVTVLAADVTGDQLPDVITASYSDSVVGNLSFFAARPDGTLAPAVNHSWCTAACETLGLAAGDLDSDKRADIVAVNHAQGTLQVLLSRCP